MGLWREGDYELGEGQGCRGEGLQFSGREPPCHLLGSDLSLLPPPSQSSSSSLLPHAAHFPTSGFSLNLGNSLQPPPPLQEGFLVRSPLVFFFLGPNPVTLFLFFFL